MSFFEQREWLTEVQSLLFELTKVFNKRSSLLTLETNKTDKSSLPSINIISILFLENSPSFTLILGKVRLNLANGEAKK